MPETIVGTVSIQTSGGAEVVKVDPDSTSAAVVVRNAAGLPLLTVNAANGTLFLGVQGTSGKVVLVQPSGSPGMTFDGGAKTVHAGTVSLAPGVTLTETGDISAGGGGTVGQLWLRNAAGDEAVRVDADPAKMLVGTATGGDVWVYKAVGDARIHLDGKAGTVRSDAVVAGAQGANGQVVVQDTTGKAVLVLDGATADIVAGGNGKDGNLFVRDASGKNILTIQPNQGNTLTAGGNGKDGSLSVRGSGDHTVAILSGVGQQGGLTLRNADKESIYLNGANGTVQAGGATGAGSVRLRSVGGAEVVTIDAASGDVNAGGGNTNGTVRLRNTAGNDVITLDAATGDVVAGGGGHSADLVLKDVTGKDTIHLRAQDGMLRVGGNGQHGDILVLRADNSMGIQLNGETGDITLPNADCAEEFDVAGGVDIEPGTTVVLDDDGKLRASDDRYDRKVVGVIAGAGEYRPGILLDRRRSSEPRAALSMVGKVYCKVDATDAPIEVGDLLTTSATPGHAMKATDPGRAFGAVIGKALGPLPDGRGLVPILVALQ